MFTMDTNKDAEVRRRIGNEIRAARARARLTQMQLAEKSGISRATIARYEAGERSVSVEHLLTMALVMDADAGKMLDAAQFGK